jgi:hypothetical protein
MVPPFFYCVLSTNCTAAAGAYVETLLASRRYMQRISGQIHGLTDTEGRTDLRPALPFSKQFSGAVHCSLSQGTSEGGSY